MRNVDHKLSEAAAREMLERIIQRAEQLNAETREFIAAVAIRPETFVACLRSNPNIVAWSKMRDLQYRPEYVAADGTKYVVSISRLAMSDPYWRSVEAMQ